MWEPGYISYYEPVEAEYEEGWRRPTLVETLLIMEIMLLPFRMETVWCLSMNVLESDMDEHGGAGCMSVTPELHILGHINHPIIN